MNVKRVELQFDDLDKQIIAWLAKHFDGRGEMFDFSDLQSETNHEPGLLTSGWIASPGMGWSNRRHSVARSGASSPNSFRSRNSCPPLSLSRTGSRSSRGGSEADATPFRCGCSASSFRRSSCLLWSAGLRSSGGSWGTETLASEFGSDATADDESTRHRRKVAPNLCVDCASMVDLIAVAAQNWRRWGLRS